MEIELIIDESEFVYMKLQNGLLVSHLHDFGSELNIEKYSDVFDENGRLNV